METDNEKPIDEETYVDKRCKNKLKIVRPRKDQGEIPWSISPWSKISSILNRIRQTDTSQSESQETSGIPDGVGQEDDDDVNAGEKTTTSTTTTTTTTTETKGWLTHINTSIEVSDSLPIFESMTDAMLHAQTVVKQERPYELGQSENTTHPIFQHRKIYSIIDRESDSAEFTATVDNDSSESERDVVQMIGFNPAKKRTHRCGIKKENDTNKLMNISPLVSYVEGEKCHRKTNFKPSALKDEKVQKEIYPDQVLSHRTKKKHLYKRNQWRRNKQKLIYEERRFKSGGKYKRTIKIKRMVRKTSRHKSKPEELAHYEGSDTDTSSSQEMHDIIPEAAPDNFTCFLCEKLFNKKSNYLTHLSTYIDSSNKRDTMKQFEDRSLTLFPPISGSKEEIRSNYCKETCSGGNVMFQCGICKVKFDTTADIDMHIGEHFNQGQYRCTVCDSTFSSFYILLFHKKTHIHVYKCVRCGQKCNSMASLKYHTAKLHHSETAGDNEIYKHKGRKNRSEEYHVHQKCRKYKVDGGNKERREYLHRRRNKHKRESGNKEDISKSECLHRKRNKHKGRRGNKEGRRENLQWKRDTHKGGEGEKESREGYSDKKNEVRKERWHNTEGWGNNLLIDISPYDAAKHVSELMQDKYSDCVTLEMSSSVISENMSKNLQPVLGKQPLIADTFKHVEQMSKIMSQPSINENHLNSNRGTNNRGIKQCMTNNQLRRSKRIRALPTETVKSSSTRGCSDTARGIQVQSTLEFTDGETDISPQPRKSYFYKPSHSGLGVKQRKGHQLVFRNRIIAKDVKDVVE